MVKPAVQVEIFRNMPILHTDKFDKAMRVV